MQITKKVCVLIGSLMALSLTGCGGGGGGGGNGNPSPQTIQMGGARQGAVPNLLPVVSTLSGSRVSADGIGAAANGSAFAHMASDGTYLYVADKGANTIRRIAIATGEVTTLAGMPGVSGGDDGLGSAARFAAPWGVATDGTYVYVADTFNHAIRKIMIGIDPMIPVGTVTTVAGLAGTPGSADGTGSAARFNYPSGVAVDGPYLYVSDTSNHTIRRITLATGAVATVAGSAGISGSADGAGLSARFNSPYGLVATGGALYVAEAGNHTLRRIVTAFMTVTTLAGSPGVMGSADGTGSAARFSGPNGIATDGTSLFVADYNSHLVRQVTIATAAVTTLAGLVNQYGAVDGTGSEARLNKPAGVAVAGIDLYVSDQRNRTVRKIVTASGAVTTFVSRVIGSDGVASVARFGVPEQVTTDGTALYLADSSTHMIRKIMIATGETTTLAGSFLAWGANDGIGSAAMYNTPGGLTTDGVNVYVADTYNHTIRKIVIATGEVTTLAGQAGSVGAVDGVGANARFSYPNALTTNGVNLYVTDRNNHTIRRIVIATGEVTTYAGSPGSMGAADGSGGSAQFRFPSSITTDGSHLFVADRENHTVRRITMPNDPMVPVEVTTLVGMAGSHGSTDGIGAAARFNQPQGIATDGNNLYVADTTNQTVRKIVIATGAVTTVAGLVTVPGSLDGNALNATFWNPVGITTDGVRLFVTDSIGAAVRVIQ